MPKCRDNRKRKQRIAKRERDIKKWCENYEKKVYRVKRINLVGGYQFYPHPYKGGAKDDRHVRPIWLETSAVSVGVSKYNILL